MPQSTHVHHKHSCDLVLRSTPCYHPDASQENEKITQDISSHGSLRYHQPKRHSRTGTSSVSIVWGGLSLGSDLTTSTAIDDEDAMHTLHKIVAINSRAQVG